MAQKPALEQPTPTADILRTYAQADYPPGTQAEIDALQQRLEDLRALMRAALGALHARDFSGIPEVARALEELDDGTRISRPAP